MGLKAVRGMGLEQLYEERTTLQSKVGDILSDFHGEPRDSHRLCELNREIGRRLEMQRVKE